VIPACGIFPGRFFVTIFWWSRWRSHVEDYHVAHRPLPPETRLVHSGTLRSQFGETSEAMFLTQGLCLRQRGTMRGALQGEDPGYIYSRYSNPTISMFERRMIELEGAEACRSTATGMAAVTTAMLAPLRAGDHVVAAKAMFGSCRYVVEDLLPRYGISSTLVDGLDLDQWQAAMRPNTKSCFLESPTKPDARRARYRRHRRDRAIMPARG